MVEPYINNKNQKIKNLEIENYRLKSNKINNVKLNDDELVEVNKILKQDNKNYMLKNTNILRKNNLMYSICRINGIEINDDVLKEHENNIKKYNNYIQVMENRNILKNFDTKQICVECQNEGNFKNQLTTKDNYKIIVWRCNECNQKMIKHKNELTNKMILDVINFQK